MLSLLMLSFFVYWELLLATGKLRTWELRRFSLASDATQFVFPGGRKCPRLAMFTPES
jgi:hypothetical protein